MFRYHNSRSLWSLVLAMLTFARGTYGAAFVHEFQFSKGSRRLIGLSCRTSVLLMQQKGVSCSPEIRRQLLHEKLRTLHVDPELMHKAATTVLEDPTKGYDMEFGKSAIRTYKAFIFPKTPTIREENEQLELFLKGAADRSARQIEFLMKRHRSHMTEWVRHTDKEEIVADNKDRLTASKSNKFPLILILDNVRSAFNVGSIFRTADACGCKRVVTIGITSHPFGSGAEKLAKSALGAEYSVESQHFDTMFDAIQALREEFPRWCFVGMETTENSVQYTEIAYPLDGVVLMLGNEVTGVDPDVLAKADQLVEIPMFGSKNSLNVAACAPVVLYEILRQWEWRNPHPSSA